MDLITKAIDELKFTIPREILKLAYCEREDYRAAPLSLDEEIRRKTIMARVLVDTNIAGGDTVIVDLKGLTPKIVDQYNYIYEIPADRVNGRTILTALSVSYMSYNALNNRYLPGASGYPSAYGGSDVLSAGRNMMNSRSSIPVVGTSDCIMVGHNTVMIRNHVIRAAGVQLRCVVTNDERLSNISIRSSPQFSQLCKYAVKSYIYNTLMVKLDRGYLERGQELGVIKSYVDGLSDAEENYQTYLREEWGVQGIFNDRLSNEDFLMLQGNISF